MQKTYFMFEEQTYFKLISNTFKDMIVYGLSETFFISNEPQLILV